MKISLLIISTLITLAYSDDDSELTACMAKAPALMQCVDRSIHEIVDKAMSVVQAKCFTDGKCDFAKVQALVQKFQAQGPPPPPPSAASAPALPAGFTCRMEAATKAGAACLSDKGFPAQFIQHLQQHMQPPPHPQAGAPQQPGHPANFEEQIVSLKICPDNGAAADLLKCVHDILPMLQGQGRPALRGARNAVLAAGAHPEFPAGFPKADPRMMLMCGVKAKCVKQLNLADCEQKVQKAVCDCAKVGQSTFMKGEGCPALPAMPERPQQPQHDDAAHVAHPDMHAQPKPNFCQDICAALPPHFQPQARPQPPTA